MKTELTENEQQVLKLVLKGYSYPEIAEERGVSTQAVKNMTQNLRRKLGAEGDAELKLAHSREKAKRRAKELGDEAVESERVRRLQRSEDVVDVKELRSDVQKLNTVFVAIRKIELNVKKVERFLKRYGYE